jgi:hypothetical protein
MWIARPDVIDPDMACQSAAGYGVTSPSNAHKNDPGAVADGTTTPVDGLFFDPWGSVNDKL